MECNKYEAIRAKEVAETKMHKNDFNGARKLALKAQQIYPDTDNIAQLITVCDVHCASQKKIDAYEMDWYGILQIAQTSDDSIIKKNYRKLALLLHPDKNKFPGAEAAFKLIGEAHRLLSDPVRRRMHDMKRKPFVKSSMPYQPANNQYAPKQPFQGGSKGPQMPQYANVNLRQQYQPSAQPASSLTTFATVCPDCSNLRHAPVSDKNRYVLCYVCNKTFIAMEAKSDYSAKDKNYKKACSVKKNIPNQGKSATGGMPKENIRSKDVHTNGSTEATGSKGVMNSNDTKSKKINKRKRKKSKEDSDSESESDTDEDEIFVVDDELSNIPDTGIDGLRNPRRSTRQKHKVSYDESHIDDEVHSHDVAAKVSSASENAGAEVNEDVNKMDHCNSEPASKESSNHFNTAQKMKNESPAESGNETHPYSCPDPDFNNFDDLRKEECFKVGQLWALYDDDGAMPRFYGRIKAVYRPTKELCLTWLERVSNNDMSQKSTERKLPCSCGKYIRGETQIIAMGEIFSHPVVWKKGNSENIYCIYPQQGQIWALFKNNQAFESASTKTYEYDYVEVISDYVEGHGLTVAYLGKAKGYGSIFSRMDSNGNTYSIPHDEISRFSHMIPSFKLFGEERGVFELDPLLVPADEKAVIDLGDLKILPANFKPAFEYNDAVDNFSEDESEDSDSADPEFFNFESNKCENKFEANQIWAVYDEDDGMPKRYVLILSVNSSPEFKLIVKWLNLGGKQGDIIKWKDNKMHAGCGIFKLGRKKPQEFPPDTFSHIVKPRQTDKEDEFAILPAKGEVWALYKNWKPEMNSDDIEAFEYEIAEVQVIDEVGIRVLLLQQDSGHKTVFKSIPNKEILTIPKEQLLRFSHQIPAFQLTDELDGTFRGCWELDPAAIPQKLLFPS